MLQATGLHDSVAFSASPVYSHLDIPAIVRCRSSLVQELFEDNGYDMFMKELRTRAKRKLLSGLPKTLSGLKGLPLPETLAELLERLCEAHSEAGIVVAFYQALLEYDGKGQFDSPFQKKIESIIGNNVPAIEAVVAIVDCLNGLRNAPEQLGANRYDIPAFLRKHAD